VLYYLSPCAAAGVVCPVTHDRPPAKRGLFGNFIHQSIIINARTCRVASAFERDNCHAAGPIAFLREEFHTTRATCSGFSYQFFQFQEIKPLIQYKMDTNMKILVAVNNFDSCKNVYGFR
jgi:hypothetical protein